MRTVASQAPSTRLYDHGGRHRTGTRAGNVEEWTASAYRPYPGGRAIEDDFFDAYGLGYAVVRGGSFALGGDVSRCARRHGQLPAPAYHRYVGLRLAADV